MFKIFLSFLNKIAFEEFVDTWTFLIEKQNEICFNSLTGFLRDWEFPAQIFAIGREISSD